MSAVTIELGRGITGELEAAERREGLCTNGIGGFAAGTVAGSLTRRYHGLLVAALAPPLGRTLVVAKAEECAKYGGRTWPLGTNRWASGAVAPRGFREIESFRLDGTTPVWTYALADALLEKRVWMEPGANTTYVRYRATRAGGPLGLHLKVLVNHRDYHAVTRGGEWRMDVAPVAHGLRAIAFDGARPVLLLAPGAEARIAHAWYEGMHLPEERARGLEDRDDHLHVATFRAALAPARRSRWCCPPRRRRTSTATVPGSGASATRQRSWRRGSVRTPGLRTPRPGSASWCSPRTSSSSGGRLPTIPTG